MVYLGFFQCLSDGPVEPVPPGKSNVNMYPSSEMKKRYITFLLSFFYITKFVVI